MSTSQAPMIPSDGIVAKAPATANGNGKEEAAAKLPKLPLPKLEDTCTRYLRALEPLQDEDDHERTKSVVKDFLESGEGAKWQKKLEEYNDGVDSYIEEFWYESYLSFQDSVVLSLVSDPSCISRTEPELMVRIRSLCSRESWASV
jgi:carnitine O-acetyltransferase